MSRICPVCGKPFASGRLGPRATCSRECRRQRERDLELAKRVRRGQSIAPVQHPWTAQAKVRLVDEVAAGKATREEICERHNISAEEFECWSQAYAVGGINALKLKGIQQRRASC